MDVVKPRPTRSINPLHFEDLDPHRFEDLVRQLVYGYRSWVILEATGRSGADDGVDIRAVESLAPPRSDESDADGGDELLGEQRVWFIQCKREKSLGPAKARAIAGAASSAAPEAPHGFLLAAPCQLSKRTRDTLAAELRSAGVREVVTWGRADLEDQLFRPEHDHLLFAYFGISIQVRRRNLRSELRSRLGLKRQIFRAVGDLEHRGVKAVLLRDPSEPNYPFSDRVEAWDADDPAWLWTAFHQHSNPDTLAVVYQRHHAWLSANRKSYDIVEGCSHVLPHRHGFAQVPHKDEAECDRLWRYYHNEIPKDERAWLETVGWIRFDDILLVDDLGDAFHDPPHILLRRDNEHGFFTHTRRFLTLDQHGSHERFDPAELRRTRKFPDPIPEVEWKREW